MSDSKYLVADPLERLRFTILNARRVVEYHQYPPDEAWSALLTAAENYLTATLKCWCGGDIGLRVPGDILGWGCLADINHIWHMVPQLGQSQWVGL